MTKFSYVVENERLCLRHTLAPTNRRWGEGRAGIHQLWLRLLAIFPWLGIAAELQQIFPASLAKKL